MEVNRRGYSAGIVGVSGEPVPPEPAVSCQWVPEVDYVNVNDNILSIINGSQVIADTNTSLAVIKFYLDNNEVHPESVNIYDSDYNIGDEIHEEEFLGYADDDLSLDATYEFTTARLMLKPTDVWDGVVNYVSRVGNPIRSFTYQGKTYNVE